MFSGSVRENIRYGRLEASDEEVREAARRVNADGFIMALEDGYDTDVGEGGNRLSTVRTADRILVIEKGRIIESGGHAELLAEKGHYHALYTFQFAAVAMREGSVNVSMRGLQQHGPYDGQSRQKTQWGIRVSQRC